MSGKAAKIVITEKQQIVLKRIRQATTAPSRLVQRAKVILMGFSGKLNKTIAEELGLAEKQVGVWRLRWQASFDALVAIECNECQATLHRVIEDTLSDAPRSGSPGTFTAEQVTQILAIACESPELSGRPIDRWTHRELTDEVIARRIVSSLSVSQVGRYLLQSELQPHRSKYWLTTKEKDPEVFEQQVQTVCQSYLDAPDLYFQENTYTVSVDEMPGIQALERTAKTIPMQSGQVERIEYEYKRHGTLCLTGNWDVVQGQLISPTIGTTRTEEDFLWHIFHTVQTDAKAGWVFVVDNLNTHCSEALVHYVARLEGLDESELGKKGKFGILKSMETRKAFLWSLDHRIRFVYLPKHTSWLNQIEIVFGIVGRRVVRRGNFPSLAALQDKLLQFIDYFNRTFARPFRWTYTGRPVAATTVQRPATWKEDWARSRQDGEALALVG